MDYIMVVGKRLDEGMNARWLLEGQGRDRWSLELRDGGRSRSWKLDDCQPPRGAAFLADRRRQQLGCYPPVRAVAAITYML